jgi:hypothetical protein
MVGMNWGRTQADIPIRGGALASGFDQSKMQDHKPLDGVGVIPAEQVWENYAYFIERVGPVAAEHGVKMGLHPDDPPVPSIRGVGRIFGTVAGFDRALGLLDAPTRRTKAQRDSAWRPSEPACAALWVLFSLAMSIRSFGLCDIRAAAPGSSSRACQGLYSRRHFLKD